MRLYYGADKLVVEPKFNYGNPTNDYGCGFYLTPNKDIAKLWASKNPDGGYLITYDVDLSNLVLLKLDNYGEDEVLRWITILVSHRFSREERARSREIIKWLEDNYPISLDGIDVVVGYRADDSYFDYSREFVNDNLSLEVLSEAMVLGKLGIQYVLKSEKSFRKIKYVSSEKVEHSNDYELFRKGVKSDYLKLKETDNINNTFIRDIIRRKENKK